MENRNEEENIDPRELILLAKAGNSEAFGSLYKLYYTPIYRYIHYRLKDKDEVPDLVQTVFLKVYNALSSISETTKEPLAYFYTVARNTLIDYRRKKKDIYILDDEFAPDVVSEERGADEIFDDTSMFESVRSAMKELSKEQQEVLTLKFIQDLSYKEIAQILGKREDAVRQLQSRGLKILKDTLDKKTK